MLTRVVTVLALAATVAFTAAVPSLPAGHLTVHEWGTFTTVAGAAGGAIDWLPLGGPTDLPCFVEHFSNRQYKIALSDSPPVDYDSARAGLTARVRMETPVLYFYAPDAMTAHVHIRFPHGVMTEWYPKATVTQTMVAPLSLRDPKEFSTIDWPEVKISPSATPVYPTSKGPSHYYAARETDAAPLGVGEQREKFLFYRGVADFDVPMNVIALTEGGVRIRNLGNDNIPNAVLFENYGGKIGFRITGAIDREITLDDPPLTSDFATLRPELERMLVANGLYPREAKAMVETWRDSWFEEGTRVFYIVPAKTVDAILPLTVEPAPEHVARVFVGRMEVISEATAHAVENAVARNDVASLNHYGRFLGPIADRYLTRPAQGPRVRELTNAAFASYVAKASLCR